MTVYTAIYGDYDTLKEPTIITEGWKYICFTNNKKLKSDVWDIRYRKNKNLSNKLASRCIKIRYFDYIKDDLTIWCDASTQINCDLNDFIETYHRGNFSTTQHPVRNCVYQEALACLELNKDNPDIIKAQVLSYRDEGLPLKVGMIQSGLMVRNDTPEVREHCRLWFNELQKFSGRDQLSFNYILWKHELIKPYLMGVNVFRNEFILNKHKQTKYNTVIS